MKPRLHDHLYLLLELLTAVIVISLLVAGIVGLGRYARSRCRERVTERVMRTVLLPAAQAYRQAHGAWPAERKLLAGDSPARRICGFLAAVEGHDKHLLDGLPQYLRQTVRGTGGRKWEVICDGWGVPIRYVVDNDQALFISAGPDRIHDHQGGDDLRSDGL
jgi:hypothetical protein